LANNKLTGSIPPVLGTLRNLYAINITQNRDICGDVPSQVSGVVEGLNTTATNSMCQWEADGELQELQASGALSRHVANTGTGEIACPASFAGPASSADVWSLVFDKGCDII
jgi:hypothetical protein